VAEGVARILVSGEGVDEEQRVDGRCLEIRRRRLRDGTIVLTYTDVTPRHEAELARRAQRDALRRAEQSEATASLLAGVAHEINNPLAVVAAQAVLLAEEAEGTALASRAEKVREAAQRCGRIVASLTASARRRAHRREEVDLARAVAAGLDLAGYGLRAAGIALEQRVPRDLPRLRGDPDQIAHLVANLVTNARAALDGAPPPRRARADRGASGGTRWSCASPTTARGSRRRCASASSPRSSPPSRTGWAPGWGWRCAARWWARTAGPSGRRRPRAAARPWWCGCRCRRGRGGARTRRPSRARRRGDVPTTEVTPMGTGPWWTRPSPATAARR
jgi:hypothetical protein